MAGLDLAFAFSKAADWEALGKLDFGVTSSPVFPLSLSAILAALFAAFSKAALTVADTIPKTKGDRSAVASGNTISHSFPDTFFTDHLRILYGLDGIYVIIPVSQCHIYHLFGPAISK